MTFFYFLHVFAAGFAALCAIAIGPWILGVPGQDKPETPYIRGWKMGFVVVWIYPIMWTISRIAFWIARYFGWVDAHNIENWFVTVIFAVALARMIWAIKILIDT